MDSEVYFCFFLIHKRFTTVEFYFFSKLILFLGQQSKCSNEQIRKTAVKNKGAGKKRKNIQICFSFLSFFFLLYELKILTPPEQNMLV